MCPRSLLSELVPVIAFPCCSDVENIAVEGPRGKSLRQCNAERSIPAAVDMGLDLVCAHYGHARRAITAPAASARNDSSAITGTGGQGA